MKNKASRETAFLCIALSGMSLASLLSLSSARADQLQQPQQAQQPQQQKGQAVIDFEADLIEGERRMPSIFVQLANQKPTMSSVLYLRKDFNDFHRAEVNWTPTYVPPAALPAPSKNTKKEVKK